MHLHYCIIYFSFYLEKFILKYKFTFQNEHFKIQCEMKDAIMEVQDTIAVWLGQIDPFFLHCFYIFKKYKKVGLISK